MTNSCPFTVVSKLPKRKIAGIKKYACYASWFDGEDDEFEVSHVSESDGVFIIVLDGISPLKTAHKQLAKNIVEWLCEHGFDASLTKTAGRYRAVKGERETFDGMLAVSLSFKRTDNLARFFNGLCFVRYFGEEFLNGREMPNVTTVEEAMSFIFSQRVPSVGHMPFAGWSTFYGNSPFDRNPIRIPVDERLGRAYLAFLSYTLKNADWDVLCSYDLTFSLRYTRWTGALPESQWWQFYRDYVNSNK